MKISKFFKKVFSINKFAKYKKSKIFIHPDSKVGKFTTVGFGTRITGPAFIDSKKESPVSIGKYCAIAHNLRIRTRNHYTGYINMQHRFQRRYNFPELVRTKGAINIGNGVWIGDNVTILPGVEIANGAVIGAGSIVTKSIPPYSIAVGNPAKVIKKRFSDQIIEQLQEINWWDWSEEKIKNNRRFFETDFSQIKKDEMFMINKVIVD
ncbi:CatB-related O-acetyltransferase [Pleurocapsa sp. CCALA 161]|uniref:CatB-related O-acetyltransferase n=1 Tax=Pleurocapsa sp. CCALA 161 TaxID=2107688 RepID=UPI0018EBF54A|nr:CatB-related O-acetyltransferase [Pleurocapsa sp. CCALA 161]